MKYRKKILTVGVTGALLLNISGAVSPLNNTLAEAQGATTANTDQELQKAKDEAIKKLEQYPEAFDKSLNGLADALKAKFIKDIKDAQNKDKVSSILKTVEDAHNLNKAKKEGKNFVEGLKHINEQQKVELRNMIGNMKKLEDLIPFLKDEAVKELDGFTYAFNEQLYGKEFADALKSEVETEINKAKDIDSLKAILDKVDKADKIEKAKEEGRKKVDNMKYLSPEEKRKAYHSIGNASTLEEVEKEEKKAEETEKQEKAKKENAGKEQNNPQDNGSMQPPKEHEQGGQPSVPNEKEKEELELYKQQVKEELTKKGIKNTSLIDTATTKSGVDTIKNMILKNHLETYKNKAKEMIKNLKGLDEDEKVQYKKQIDIADSESEVDEIVTTAKEIIKQKEQAKKRQTEANTDLEKIKKYVKTAAKEQIEKLKNLTQTQKDSLLKEVEKNEDVKDLEKVYKNATDFDAEVKKAKEEIENLKDLSAADKATYKEKIEKSENIQKVKENLGLAIETNRQIVETAKTKALDELKKLMNLTDDQLQKAKAEVLAGQDKKSVEKSLTDAKKLDNKELTEARAKAKEQIEKLKDLNSTDKKTYIEQIEKSENIQKVKENLGLAIEKNRQIVEEARTKALDELKKLMNLTDDQMQKAKAEVLAGQDKKSVEKSLTDAKKLDNKELTEARTKAKAEIEKLKDLKSEEKTKANSDITNSVTKKAINEVVEKAKKQDAKNKAEKVKPNEKPSGDDSHTPTPDVKPTPETKAGWKKDEKGTKYQKENGSFAKDEWEQVGETWYHFDSAGYMQTGWLNLDGTWYYLNADGSMAKDTWIGTYYVDASGTWVVEGWQNNGYGWWYQRANGTYPSNEWDIINGIWYYFDANGYMLADTTTPDGYYVDENGAWVK